MGKKKKPQRRSGGRVTPKTCTSRSANLGRQLPHKYTSSHNGTPVCSWCGAPQGSPPQYGPLVQALRDKYGKQNKGKRVEL